MAVHGVEKAAEVETYVDERYKRATSPNGHYRGIGVS